MSGTSQHTLISLNLSSIFHENFTLSPIVSVFQPDVDPSWLPAVIEMAIWFYRSLIPIFVIIGFTGNCLAWTLIRTNRTLNKLPSNIYLLALAVFSSVFLISLIFLWCDRMFYDRKLYHNRIIWCKLITFTSSCCDFCSVWLIVLVCVDRSMLFRRGRLSNSRSKALQHVLYLFLSTIVLNSFILYIVKPIPKEHETIEFYCTHDINSDFMHSLYKAFTIFEVTFCCILPSILVTLLNSYMILQLISHASKSNGQLKVTFNTLVSVHDESDALTNGNLERLVDNVSSKPLKISPFGNHRDETITKTNQIKRKPTQFHRGSDSEPNIMEAIDMRELNLPQTVIKSNSKAQKHQSVIETVPNSKNELVSRRFLSVPGPSHLLRSTQSASDLLTNSTSMQFMTNSMSSNSGKIRRTEIQLTKTLVIVTTVFLALNLPNYILRVLYALNVWSDLIEDPNWQRLITYLAYLMLYSHHAILFYLYIFYSPQMRKRLKPTAIRLAECYCLKQVPDFGHENCVV